MGTGSTIGTAGGAAIGTAILPGVGTILGGAAGGLIGGMFDKSPDTFHAGEARYGGGLGPESAYAREEANRIASKSDQQAAAFGQAAQGANTSGANSIAHARTLGNTAQSNAWEGQQGAAGNQMLSQNLQNQGMLGANTAGFQANQDRAAQQGALGRLQNFYQQGPGPSAAEAQMQQGADANMAQSIALAHSGRGAGANANAMRSAAFQNAAAGQQLNQNMGVLRANEAANWRQQQLGAMGMEQNTIAGMRGQSIGQQGQGQQFATAMGQQGLGYGQLGAQYQGMGNQAQAAFEGQGVQAGLGYGQQGLGYSQLGEQTSQYGENMKNKILEYQGNQQQDQQHVNAAAAGAAMTDSRTRDAANQNFMGTVMSSGVGMMGQGGGGQVGNQGFYGSSYGNPDSDVRVKKDIQPANMSAVFGNGGADLRPAQGYTYQYKDPNSPGGAPGQQIGPMAQDLEKTPAGASTVHTGPDGKKSIDPGRLSLVNAAAVSELQRRTDELEAMLNQRAKYAPGEQLPGPTQPASNIGFHQSGATGIDAMQAGPYGLPTQEEADAAAQRRQAFGR